MSQQPAQPDTPDVTVIAVTFDPGASLTAFLDSLTTAGGPVAAVVLADNGEGDQLDPVVDSAQQRPGVRVVRTGSNLGYGRAVNIAAATIDTEFVVVANPDVVWSPGSLQTLLEAARRWPRGGSFGPRIYTESGLVYPSARALPSLGRGIGHAVCGWWWPSNPWTTSYRNERRALGETPVGWLSGACLLLRRSAFEAIGGFDEAYFMYFEDVDLGDRLGRAGWQNVYVPDAEVTHIGAHATSRDPARMATEHHRSAWIYLSRRYAGLRWAPVRLVLRAGLRLRSALSRRAPSVAAGARPNNPGK
ncbi:N-acetylglucosaminyl-diphospho-decaprenol L-rhamnosyltransferase [Jatrophihabitans sp. GAS493]|uniref:glycosyltransferase family 2 protein n=1 Tax=Jatrophihabitans sp. GAS493 TaxID=1907575 RepID=UPI000BB80F7B|nr:glycosyltransferase family 2 protein [Jatrophihabitans sp. GAS493]SOD73016.1 N-acetylglucosaminyl-diphospho-decaprenol L-rhamnosyltransferase [Jatrophihabitans sp. GAS493]